ncbi:MAG TPA: spherulation-specific family 4 protein [Polyangia bacterium]|jgi:hypothetical protein|nr:spherulation-specific family 4 protein [Polyangia bacterium]
MKFRGATWTASLWLVASGCGDNKPAIPRAVSLGDAAVGGDPDAAPMPLSADSPRMFVPTYVYPGPEWDRVIAAAPRVGIMVANPADGPGSVADPAYQDAIARAKQAGIMVLGYVATFYGQRPSAEVIADINTYYDLYGPSGIFLSEGPIDTDCSAMEAMFLAYANAARTRDAQAFVALGTRYCPTYIYFSDLIVLFSAQREAYDAFQPAEWMPSRSPERFAHLVIGVPGEAMEATVRRARALGAGWIYVTDDDLPNPWDQLPSYFEQELRVMSTLK